MLTVNYPPEISCPPDTSVCFGGTFHIEATITEGSGGLENGTVSATLRHIGKNGDQVVAVSDVAVF